MKFGGTSVADLDCIRPVASLAKGGVALASIGVSARSWMGWQIPVRTSAMHGAARIESIDPKRLDERFARGEVAVVAGFQGVAPDNRISTLGRGGSDTSASRCDC